MDLMTVADAARALGVTTRQVQHLVHAGEIERLGRGIVDGVSVERLLTTRGDTPRRAWGEATAWGAVALLEGSEAGWLGESQRSRLRSRLRSITAEELVERCRGRAIVTHYVVHASVERDLTARLVGTGAAANRLGLTTSAGVDGYIQRDEVDDVVRELGLVRDPSGSVTLRATETDVAVVRRLAGEGTVLAALDLATSLRVRERRAGLDGLDRRLRVLRG